MREYQAQQRLIVKHIDGNVKSSVGSFYQAIATSGLPKYCRAIGLVSGTKELVNENFY